MQEDIKLALNVLWSQVASLFFVLLAISGILSIYLGDKNDGIIIFAIMFANIVMGFYQEFKASKASEKLLHLVQSKVYVFRKGKLVQILASELVLGDIVHFVAGSVAPVDVEVVESESAFIDDSVRTGETEPKEINMGEKLYAGAIVAGGKIVGRVIALGDQSSLSKYRAKLESVKKYSSFAVFTEKVVKYIFIISIITLLIAMIFLVFVMHKYELVQFFIFAIAMLVGVVPEMLPLIITLILTRESLLLSKNKVIVKRLSSLQGLGSVQFLLTDKTGTITENKLKVSTVNDVNNFWEASNAISEGEYERTPMDEAFDNALNSSIGKIKTSARKIKSFEPFKSSVGYSSYILEGGDKVARGQSLKVFALCKNIKESIKKSALEYEKKGMRVIAIAEGRAGEWNFSGYVAFDDPIKSSASESLRIAHERGIGVKILTGDSKAVAVNVAEELGLIKTSDNVISFEDVKVADLSDKQLRRAVVFAKCTPENKLELIDRYIKLGPVAFLGDGINDALALKRADIGMAVDNAADIAKESADVILLEKDLSPILTGVSMGRKAFRNILTYIMYTLSGNAGTFFSLLVASFFYKELPMLPVQILLNNLLTDLPLMLIVTDNIDDYALRHVPHYEPNKIMKRVFIFGMLSSVFDFIYFQIYKSHDVASFQTGWFILSVLAELALVLSIRSSRSLFKSPALSVPLALGILVSAILPFVFVYTGGLAKVFKFEPLSFSEIMTLLGILVIYMCVNEIAKYFMRRRNLYNKPVHPAHIFKS
ncbi:MAG: HAD-IC family P-type ATPase [Patescibacteria group bacterium]